MESIHVHPRLRDLDALVRGIETAARLSSRAARKVARATKSRRTFATLRPGPATPLWNELARACEKHLARHGDKARLARILGLPRQRVHSFLVAKNACPDAERTLLLLIWLRSRRRGVTPA